MLLSNLHSFHFAKKLQNATALPAHIYRKISNRRSVNSEADLPYVSIAETQSQKPAPRRGTGQASSAGFEKSPFHELRKPVVIEGSATRKPSGASPPVTGSAVKTQTKPSNRSGPTSKPPGQPERTTKKTSNPEKPSHRQAGRRRKPAASPEVHSGSKASKPVNATNKPSPQPHRPATGNVWKPGHGTIEKVDKLTGEIVHLVE